MHEKLSNYTKIALEGGGVLGIAYVGALLKLEAEHPDFLDQIDGVAGTSAGAITALMLALRVEPHTMNQVMWNLSFPDFEDHGNLFQGLSRYGLHPGTFALELFEKIITGEEPKAPNQDPSETGRITFSNKDATFADLKASGGRDLRIFAGNLNRKSLQEFSWDATPDVSLAQAARASMSIPIFFEAFQMQVHDTGRGDVSSGETDEIDTFVDGGVLYNYPYTAFEEEGETLGMFFKPQKSRIPIPKGKPITYLKALVGTLLESRYTYAETEDIVKENTIYIDTDGIRAVDFGLTDAQKKTLERNGMDAVANFLSGSDG